jgi:magnesium-transporting ATPase (P-type)
VAISKVSKEIINKELIKLFSGSLVIKGYAKAQVQTTGMNSEIGKIGNKINYHWDCSLNATIKRNILFLQRVIMRLVVICKIIDSTTKLNLVKINHYIKYQTPH